MKNDEPAGFLDAMKAYLVQIKHDQTLLLFSLVAGLVVLGVTGWLLRAIFLPLLFQLKFMKKRKVHKIFWN